MNRTRHVANCTNHVSNPTSDVSNRTSHVSNRTSHVVNRTSHVSNRTSEVTNPAKIFSLDSIPHEVSNLAYQSEGFDSTFFALLFRIVDSTVL